MPAAWACEEVVARFERYVDTFAYMFEDGHFDHHRIGLVRMGSSGTVSP